MRLTRRGCYVGRREPKFVWGVYAVETGYHADETTTPYTGTFTLSVSSRYKMAASSYTATQTTFTLTDPVQTTRANLKVGDYVVNVSTSSSTAVSGSYLYRITAISGNTFTYTRWEPSAYERKGSTELYRVESDTADYPIEGAQGGYWYVMVKGERPMYVWDMFNIRRYYSKQNAGKRFDLKEARLDEIYIYRYNFSSVTGLFEITSLEKTFPLEIDQRADGTMAVIGPPMDYNWLPERLNVGDTSDIMYQGATWSYSDYYSTSTCTSLYAYIGVLTDAKGTATGQTVESESQDAYPQDGTSGDKWYTYSHSYSKPFDNR